MSNESLTTRAVAAGYEGAVPRGADVLAVEEHDGERPARVHRALARHESVRLEVGKAASYARSSGHSTSAVTTAEGRRYRRL